MKTIITLLFSVLLFTSSRGQVIYSKDYGDKQNPAIIFIHGGPGGNANLFEATTAQNLADKGFYVIVYDRRGEGRSKDEQADMTFEESFEDLLQVYSTYHIKKAHLIGHSFGGIMATLFTQRHPGQVHSLTLAAALVAQQETYNHILKRAKAYFKTDTLKIKEILATVQLPKNTAAYRKRCYEMADIMHFFTMPVPTAESNALRQQYENSELYRSSFRNRLSPEKFYKNEDRNNLDNKPVLKQIKKLGIPVYAVYGENDGIFPAKQLQDIQEIVGRNNFSLITNCSHYLFVDQQAGFLNFVTQKLL